MSKVEQKLRDLGLELPEAPKPVGSYAPAVRSGKFVFISGQLPFKGDELKFKGKLGKDLTVEQGYEASKLCAINSLSQIKALFGSLDIISRVVKVAGYVNSEPAFSEHPKVINGASDLYFRLLGERGRHARIAVGVSSLPLDAAVELEVTVETYE